MESLSPSRRRALALGALVLVVALLGFRHLTRSSGAAVAVPPVAGAPVKHRKTVLVVHVVGAVRRPGLYRLPGGSRVNDAVERAGGATRKANLEGINLAAPLADGLQVVVSSKIPGSQPTAAASGSTGGASQGPLDLNSATLEQLEALPGVGPVTAQKILDYRQQHGAFTSVSQLDAVPGIGPAHMAQLKGLVAP
jgi:competence protein ComEA